MAGRVGSAIATLGLRNSGIATRRTEFAAAAPDDEPLDPASRSCGLGEQVEDVAVGVPSERRERTKSADSALS